MFATLAGGYPRPRELRPDETLALVVEAQVAAGLGVISDGQVHPAAAPPDELVAAWRATRDAVERAAPGLPAKLAVEGPWAACMGSRADVAAGEAPDAAAGAAPLDTARVLHAGLLALAGAGCPYVEVHEPAGTLLSGAEAGAMFGAAHAALLAGLPEALHVSLAVTGGTATVLGADVLAGLPYRSHLFDLLDGPDSWRVAAGLPAERGIVVGVGDASGRRRTRLEDVAWAASYAASTRGRGMDRVGVAPSGSLAALDPERARAVLDLLGEAAATLAAGREEVLARLDPQAIDSRSAALGRLEPPRRG